MRYFLDMLGVMLVLAGLFLLGRLLLGWLLAPVGTKAAVLTVLFADGDGETLEHDVRGLLWLRGSGLARLRVVIADCGLNERGRGAALLLTQRWEDVTLCPAAEVGALVRGSSPSGESPAAVRGDPSSLFKGSGGI